MILDAGGNAIVVCQCVNSQVWVWVQSACACPRVVPALILQKNVIEDYFVRKVGEKVTRWKMCIACFRV